MYKETVTFTDLNDVEREEDCYFHLNEAELMKLEAGITGGFVEMIDKAIKAKDGKTILDTFDDIMHKSYGVKSADGRKFIKNEEVWLNFKETEAYSIIFTKLVTDADYASKFIAGIIPKNIKESVKDVAPAAKKKSK